MNTAMQRRPGWVFALSFLVGAVLFVVAGVGAFGADGWIGPLNFVGAILFSVGSVAAVVDARNATRAQGLRQLWAHSAGRAALIQLPAAVIFFQVAMTAGLVSDRDWLNDDLWVWTPSTIGSIGFVISSWIAWWATPATQRHAWRATAAGLGGSVGFLTGSVTGYANEPIAGIAINELVNPTFVVGSALFAIASIDMIADLRGTQPMSVEPKRQGAGTD